MNRAEKRRQKKLAEKVAKTLRPAQENFLVLTEQKQALTIQQALDLGIKHQKAGDLLKAENIYQQILQAEPNQPVALHSLGMIAHHVGKCDIAVDLIKKALVVKPQYAEAYCNLGLIYQDFGKTDEAIFSYRKAIEINPDIAGIHYNLGNVLQEVGALDEAVDSYRTTISINSEIINAHVNLGNAFNSLGKLDEAVDSYQKALAINPNHNSRFNLGRVLLRVQGKYKEGLKQMRKSRGVIEFVSGKETGYNILH